MNLIITGDVYLGPCIEINSDVIQMVSKNDFIINNFENVICAADLPKRKDKFSILTTREDYVKKYIDSLKCTEVIFSVANNHINDLGVDGINKTVQMFDKHEIIYTGLYKEDTNHVPLIVERDGIKVALLAASTDNPEVMSIVAEKRNEGVFDYKNAKFVEMIENVKNKADIVVVLPHWGIEYMDLPSIDNRKLAYSWIDAGADIVIGHHPHVIQGKEFYKNRPIYYSVGNFIFPDFVNKNGIISKWKEENNYSVAVELTIDGRDESIHIKEHGFFFNTCKNRLQSCNHSIQIMKNKSQELNSENVDIKAYYKLWEKNYLELLNKKYSFWGKVKIFFTREHTDYNRVIFIINQIFKKIIGKKL